MTWCILIPSKMCRVREQTQCQMNRKLCEIYPQHNMYVIVCMNRQYEKKRVSGTTKNKNDGFTRAIIDLQESNAQM